MKKILIFFLLTIILALPFVALAQGTPATQTNTVNALLDQAAGSGGAGYDTSIDETGFARVVGTIARIFISLIGIFFVAYTIYGGYLYLLSAGNEEMISKAKAIIKNGIIGIVIIICAAAIYAFIASVLLTGTTPVSSNS